jgi:hypothetical protein
MTSSHIEANLNASENHVKLIRRYAFWRSVQLPNRLTCAHCGRLLDIYKERKANSADLAQGGAEPRARMILSSPKTRRVCGLTLVNRYDKLPASLLELSRLVGLPTSLLSAMHSASSEDVILEALAPTSSGSTCATSASQSFYRLPSVRTPRRAAST